MKKYLLLIIISAFSAICLGQTNDTKSKGDTSSSATTIDLALMDRVLFQQDEENTHSHSMLNASFKICAKRLQMVYGYKNRNYLIGFFNQVLQAASHSILSDGSIEENFLHILRNEEDAVTFALKYPNVDVEQESNNSKSRLTPLTLN